MYFKFSHYLILLFERMKYYLLFIYRINIFNSYLGNYIQLKNFGNKLIQKLLKSLMLRIYNMVKCSSSQLTL